MAHPLQYPLAFSQLSCCHLAPQFFATHSNFPFVQICRIPSFFSALADLPLVHSYSQRRSIQTFTISLHLQDCNISLPSRSYLVVILLHSSSDTFSFSFRSNLHHFVLFCPRSSSSGLHYSQHLLIQFYNIITLSSRFVYFSLLCLSLSACH